MATLFFGFGNKDRQDDGVAWHVLNGLSVALGNPATAEIAEDFAQTSEPALVFQLQLMPEQSELSPHTIAFVSSTLIQGLFLKTFAASRLCSTINGLL